MNEFDKKLEELLKAPKAKFRLLEGDCYPRMQPPMPVLIGDFETEEKATGLAKRLNEAYVPISGDDICSEIVKYLMNGQNRVFEKTYFVTDSDGVRLY